MSIVLACIPPDEEPNKMLAVVKVVGSSAVLVAIGAVVYLLGRRRAQVRLQADLKVRTAQKRLRDETRLTPSSVTAAAAFAWHAAARSRQRLRTMRVDYYHTGNAKEERFSLDRVVLEPLPWPGNPARPIDSTNRGKYFFEVADAASGAVLYSRGFSSIYGEWETTGEAEEMQPDVFRVAAVSRARQAGPHRRQEARREERVSRGVDASRSIRPTSSSRAAPSAGRRAADQAARERRSGDEAGPADSRRRLHRARAGEVRARRAAARRDAARDLAVQGAAERHQRLGPVARRRRSRASRGRRSTSTGGRRSAPPTTRSIPSATC